MNDRIKLLWDEAWDDDTPLSIIRERFAELIVRECANVVSNQYSEDWGKWSHRMILEHFGVAE
jgi:predicted acylesterase/phospholipase RssA